MDPLLTTNEVAEFFRVKPRTIRQWVKDGRLAAVHLAGSKGYRFRQADLEAVAVPEHREAS